MSDQNPLPEVDMPASDVAPVQPALEPAMPVVRGAQTVLSGDAQAAARGEKHPDMLSNMMARDAALMPTEDGVPGEGEV